jgi:hypothetical protein
MAKLQSVNSVVGKETIYVDVDDEITAIIDKVGSAKGKVVALVLPKRCPVLQSVVNMKLLKRTADKVGKNLVLVTSEPSLMPLAGATGLYVATSPSSKPVVPDAPGTAEDVPEEMEEPLSVIDGNASDEDFDPKSAAGTSVGDLAVAGAAAKAADDEGIDDTIDMNEPAADTAAEGVAAEEVGKKVAKTKKPKKDKKLNVPNFDSFRKRLIIGALLLVLLIAAWYVAFFVLPKATVTIGTDSSTIPTNLTLTLDTTANSLDTTTDTVPAVSQAMSKSNTGTAQASGQQNNGQKATGTVTMSAGVCSGNVPNDIPAGTTLSANSITYVLESSVTFNPTKQGKSCSWTGADESNSPNIAISALNGGSNGNVASASFTVTGQSGITANGSATGGTDNITTIVQQSDITNATNKATSGDTSSIKQQLEQGLEAKGLQPVPATFLAGLPQISADQQVGAAAGSVTVTATTSYSMLGVNKSDLTTLVDSNVNGQLDKGKQVILSDGVANAQFAEANPGTANNATVAMTAYSQAGPQINTTTLKKAIAGMHSADVKSYVQQTPGVTNVTVKYSPLWVDTIPSGASKVDIKIVEGGN